MIRPLRCCPKPPRALMSQNVIWESSEAHPCASRPGLNFFRKSSFLLILAIWKSEANSLKLHRNDSDLLKNALGLHRHCPSCPTKQHESNSSTCSSNHLQIQCGIGCIRSILCLSTETVRGKANQEGTTVPGLEQPLISISIRQCWASNINRRDQGPHQGNRMRQGWDSPWAGMSGN